VIEGVMDAESGDDDKDDVKLTHPTGCFGWSRYFMIILQL